MSLCALVCVRIDGLVRLGVKLRRDVVMRRVRSRIAAVVAV